MNLLTRNRTGGRTGSAEGLAGGLATEELSISERRAAIRQLPAPLAATPGEVRPKKTLDL